MWLIAVASIRSRSEKNSMRIKGWANLCFLDSSTPTAGCFVQFLYDGFADSVGVGILPGNITRQDPCGSARYFNVRIPYKVEPR